MHDITAGPGYIQIFIHNDHQTPLDFVRNLMREVFGKSESEAIAFAALMEGQDRMACGTYPPPVAKALLDTASELIEIFGHPLQITSRANRASGPCALCGALGAEKEIYRADKAAYLCSECMLVVREASEELPGDEFRFAYVALDWHFAGTPRHQFVTRSREFPGHMRADVQVAIDKLFGSPLHFFGIHEEYRYETLGFSSLTKGGRNAPAIAPPQYHDVDIGEAEPVKCLHNGLWLCRTGELRYAALLSLHREYRDEPAIRIEISSRRRCRRRVRATLLCRTGKRRGCRPLLSRQDPFARWRRRISRTIERRHGASVAGGRPRGRHPAAANA
jgi:ATP-dependent Clp protease adapter protein ClpS